MFRKPKTKNNAPCATANPTPSNEIAKPPPKAIEPTCANVPSKAAIIPVTAETVVETKRRLEALTSGKEAMLKEARDVEDELSKLLKNPKARVQGSSTQLEAELKKLEFRRSTTSMSLNDEKRILKELDNMKAQKEHLVEYETFQAKVQTLKGKKKIIFDALKSGDVQEKELQGMLRKQTLAHALKTGVEAFVTIALDVPKDKMGIVIGKNYSKLHQFEETYSVLLDVDSGTK
jgi:hypothetical protein